MPSLSEYVAAGPLATDRLLAFAKAFVAAVASDHAEDLWRGNLSPTTVEWDGEASIVLAPADHAASPPEDPGELDGREALNRVGYLAPEQCDPDRGEAGERSDVFAIGVILFELASGEHPFAEDTKALSDGDTIIDNITGYEPRTPGQIRSNLPLEWDAICACCMHKPVEQRFASALDIAPFLERLEKTGGTKRKQVRLAWSRIILALLVPISLVLLVVWLAN